MMDDLRKLDHVYFIKGNSVESVKIADITENKIKFTNGVKLDKSETSYHLSPIDINDKELIMIGFHKVKQSGDYMCYYGDCTFILTYNPPVIETRYNEDLGEVDCLKTQKSWTLKCECGSRIDGDKKTYNGILFIHQIQHYVKDYINASTL